MGNRSWVIYNNKGTHNSNNDIRSNRKAIHNSSQSVDNDKTTHNSNTATRNSSNDRP
jgi:hypothetical protein